MDLVYRSCIQDHRRLRSINTISFVSLPILHSESPTTSLRCELLVLDYGFLTLAIVSLPFLHSGSPAASLWKDPAGFCCQMLSATAPTDNVEAIKVRIFGIWLGVGLLSNVLWELSSFSDSGVSRGATVLGDVVKRMLASGVFIQNQTHLFLRI
jgi:hypothetical protein